MVIDVQCAPQVAPSTLMAIIQVESGGNPWAIGVNGPVQLPFKPQSKEQAANMATRVIRMGYSVDLGLMQINSRNLKGLGLTIEQVLDPCTNLKAGATILTRGYLGAAKTRGPGQAALKAALSAYNTGNYTQGFHNGYVRKYLKVKTQVTVKTFPKPQMLLDKSINTTVFKAKTDLATVN